MQKVAAALLIKDGKIMIAKRKSTDKLAHKWEFPGGKVEAGETPEEGLKREIKEEFGLDITVHGFFDRSIYTYEHGAIELLAYWAVCKGEPSVLTAHDEYLWTTLTDLDAFDFAPADIPFVEKLKNVSGEGCPNPM